MVDTKTQIMRKSKNLWMFKEVEIHVAGAVSSALCKKEGLPTSGKTTRIGWGRSPLQARRNAVATYEGNPDLETVLSDSAYLRNGKRVITSEYSDKLF